MQLIAAKEHLPLLGILFLAFCQEAVQRTKGEKN